MAEMGRKESLCWSLAELIKTLPSLLPVAMVVAAQAT